MLRRFLSTVLSLTAVVTPTGSVALTSRQPVHSSRVTFAEPTRVCGHFLIGDYIIVHDDARVAGGPCTTFYKLRPGRSPETVLSFYCIPRQREIVSSTTITTVPSPRATPAMRTVDLVEFQLEGDTEAHGVPPFDVHVK